MSHFVGLILIVCLSPFLLIITLVSFFDDGFPILFRQKRIGINNKLFWIYKFRTMKRDIPDIPTHLVEDRKNIYTKFGLLIRKYSLDELPQLINVIKSDIAFIGPRPALYNQEDLIKMRTDRGIDKLMPGITGWAQVNGRDKLSIAEKVEMDYYYLKNKSIWLNLKIIWLTIIKVIRGSDVQ